MIGLLGWQNAYYQAMADAVAEINESRRYYTEYDAINVTWAPDDSPILKMRLIRDDSDMFCVGSWSIESNGVET